MTKPQHKRAAVASMFQNGICQNTVSNVPLGMVFTETVTFFESGYYQNSAVVFPG